MAYTLTIYSDPRNTGTLSIDREYSGLTLKDARRLRLSLVRNAKRHIEVHVTDDDGVEYELECPGHEGLGFESNYCDGSCVVIS